jgi:hypothetical protein
MHSPARLRFCVLAWLCVCAISAQAAVFDGTVINGTTGKPQPSIGVNLIQPGQNGMQKLGSTTTDAAGKFRFDQETQPGPVLLQVVYKGVDYNHLLTPASPTTGVEVEIYELSSDPASAKVTRDIVLLEPGSQGLAVTETFLYQNATKTTYKNPASGTLQFYLPKAADGKVSVNAYGEQRMPLRQTAEKTRQPDIYKVNFALKPGETRFDVTYVLPDATKFAGHSLHPEAPTNIVAPEGVTLTGTGVDAAGQVPNTQATVYTVSSPEYSVTIEGAGSLRNDQSDTGNSGSPSIESKPPRLYDRLYWILALTGMILALGFILLFRAKLPAAEPPKRRK